MIDPVLRHSEQGPCLGPSAAVLWPRGAFLPYLGSSAPRQGNMSKGRDGPTAATVRCPLPYAWASTLVLGSSLTLATKGLCEHGQGHSAVIIDASSVLWLRAPMLTHSPAVLHRSMAHHWQPMGCQRSPALP